MGVDRVMKFPEESGRLAQLVRAPALQAGGHRFESFNAHRNGVVAQLVRVPACHAGGREFESRQPRFSLTQG